ncbi:MAG: CPBP family intramembrane metalloprotease [Oxalobacteraceae bacterium]|nr:MAG: CPBP family intramembrane metalloprotease [Oxalobacteraceae bacterium]
MSVRDRMVCWAIGLGSPVGLYLLIRLLPNGLTASDVQVLVRQVALIAIPIVWLAWLATRSPLSPTAIGLARPRWSDLGWGAGAALTGIALAVATSMVLAAWGFTVVANEQVYGSLATRPTWLILMIVVGAVISEEAVFRATVIPAIEAASGSTVLAIAVSTTAFALPHISYGIAKLPITFAGGLVLAGVFVWRRSLFTTVIAHTVNNLVPLSPVLIRSLS